MRAQDRTELQMQEMSAAVQMAMTSLSRAIFNGRDVSKSAEEAAAVFDRFRGGNDRVDAAATYNQAVAFAVGADHETEDPWILLELAQRRLAEFETLKHHLLPVDAPILERIAKIQEMIAAQDPQPPTLDL